MISIHKNNENAIIPDKCPHCQSLKFIKHGLYNNIQRFKCKCCGRTFCPRTNSPWYYSKKNNDQWFEFWQLLSTKTSLDKCSKILKINVATAFNWRHKILNAIQFLTEPENLSQEVCITKRTILENKKGPFAPMFYNSKKIWYVVAADNNDNILTTPFCINMWSKSAFNEYVFDKINESSIIFPFGDSYIYNATKNHNPYHNKNYIAEDGSWVQLTSELSLKMKNIVLKTLASFKKILASANGISTKYMKHYLAFAKSFTMKRVFSPTILEVTYPDNIYIKCIEIKGISTFAIK